MHKRGHKQFPFYSTPSPGRHKKKKKKIDFFKKISVLEQSNESDLPSMCEYRVTSELRRPKFARRTNAEDFMTIMSVLGRTGRGDTRI